MGFEFHVHGLWLIGAALFFFGALISMNWEAVAGSTIYSNIAAMLLSFILFALGGLCWVSAAVNAKEGEER